MKIIKKTDRFAIFSKRFRMLRSIRHQSQEEFAKFLGISRPTVGFYENGTRIPDALTLRQIAEKCNVSIDWLVGLSNMKTQNEKASLEEQVQGRHKVEIDLTLHLGDTELGSLLAAGQKSRPAPNSEP